MRDAPIFRSKWDLASLPTLLSCGISTMESNRFISIVVVNAKETVV